MRLAVWAHCFVSRLSGRLVMLLLCFDVAAAGVMPTMCMM
jgi:hypothetical protein